MLPIYKMQHSAAALRTALIGRKMLNFTTNNSIALTPQVGQTIEEVRSFGRQLEVVWDDGLVLNTRMKFTGSWRVYRSAEQRKSSAARAQVVIEVAGLSAVCFGASVIESHHDFDPRRHPILGRLGTDLSKVDADLDECVSRMLSYEDSDATIAEVLLDQRVMRGVGNVYRCELLWTCELHPWAKVSSLNRDECRELVTIAAEMLRANAQQVVVDPAVYGKHGKSCSRCHGVVRVTHHGEANRVLYWCSDCQIRHAGTSSSRYVTEHDTPPGVHPAEYIYLSELARSRDLG